METTSWIPNLHPPQTYGKMVNVPAIIDHRTWSSTYLSQSFVTVDHIHLGYCCFSVRCYGIKMQMYEDVLCMLKICNAVFQLRKGKK